MGDDINVIIEDSPEIIYVSDQGPAGAAGSDGLGITIDDVTKLFPIADGFLHNTTPTGTVANTVSGVWRWDPDDRCPVYQSGLGNISRVNKDIWDAGKNTTGAQVDLGKVVYPSNVSGNNFTIGLADASDNNKSAFIGVCAYNTINNDWAPVVVWGKVRGYDTSLWPPLTKLYLSTDGSGDLTNVPPPNGYRRMWVATTLNQTANGDIFVNPIHELDVYEDGWDLAGIHDRTESTISFVDGTRTFTISPTGSTFRLWMGSGVHYKTEDTVVIPNTIGLHFIYFDSVDGDLKSSLSEWEISGTSASIATVYWDGTAGWLGEERHPPRNKASREIHEMLHQTVGARYASGLTGSFAAPAASTFSMGSGEFYDDNLEHVLGAETTCRLIYRNASNQMIDTPSSILAFKTSDGTATGTLQYDNAGTPTSVTNNYFVTNWVYATNDVNEPIYTVVAQSQHNKLADARNASQPTIPNIATREWKLLYAVIYRNDTGVATFIESVDYRSSSTLPGGVISSLPASSVTFTPTAGILATNVQAALEEISGYDYEVITGTTDCIMDMQGRRLAHFTFAKTVPVNLSFSNQTASGAGGAVIEITDDGGGDTVSYPAGWREEEGTAMSVTTSGVDRWFITWRDPSDPTTYVVDQKLDIRSS